MDVQLKAEFKVAQDQHSVMSVLSREIVLDHLTMCRPSVNFVLASGGLT